MRTKSNSEHPLCELSKEEIAELFANLEPMVRIRSTQTVYGLTQAPANIGSTIVPLTIAAQRESYWETYIAV